MQLNQLLLRHLHRYVNQSSELVSMCHLFCFVNRNPILKHSYHITSNHTFVNHNYVVTSGASLFTVCPIDYQGETSEGFKRSDDTPIMRIKDVVPMFCNVGNYSAHK